MSDHSGGSSDRDVAVPVALAHAGGLIDIRDSVSAMSDSPGGFYINCSCGEKFYDLPLYDTHRGAGKSACRVSPSLMAHPGRSNNPFSKSVVNPERQLGAFFGDLDHKREVVNFYQKVGGDVQTFFHNKHQAWYVRKFFPDLIASHAGMQAPSTHTVGTIFEYNFHTSVCFRFAYLRWLPKLLRPATTDDAEPIAPDLEIIHSLSPEVEPLVRGVLDGDILVQDLLLPIRQIDPVVSVPPGDPSVIYNWVNEERYWRRYPELMGYNRQAAFVTSGDFYPWMLSSVCRYDGMGSLRVKFPSERSPFDGEEAKPNVGQLDGLSHWQNRSRVEGFTVAIVSVSEMTHFDSHLYKGPIFRTEVPFEAAVGSEIYVSFRGVPDRRSYFMVQRFVQWSSNGPVHAPRPDSPGPGEHPDL